MPRCARNESCRSNPGHGWLLPFRDSSASRADICSDPIRVPCASLSPPSNIPADTLPQEYVPTVFENLITTIPSPLDASKLIELALWDTAGQEDFDRLRPLSYNETDVVLVVFACNHRPSLMNVQDKVSFGLYLYLVDKGGPFGCAVWDVGSCEAAGARLQSSLVGR